MKKSYARSLLPVIPEKLIEFQPTDFPFVKEAPPSVLLDADFDVPHVDPIIFLRRPISFGILLVAVITLAAALLPAIQAKREEAFKE